VDLHEDKMSPSTIDIKVRDIAARQMQAGAGPKIVFLHGASGLPMWNSFFSALADKHEVVAPEHPGFGESPVPAGVRNIADMAMYYLDYLDSLEEPVHLIGHSLGGWIAAEAACRNTRKMRSVTLIAPAGLRVKGMPIGDNFIWSPEESVRNLVFDQALADRMLAREITEEEGDMILANRFMSAKLGWEPRWLNPALERWLHRIDVPAQIIWGADDKLFPVAYGKKWNHLVPGSSFDVVEKCGHLVHVEHPEQATEIVLRFLKGVAQ